MEFSSYFPIWDQLTAAEQETLSRSAVRRTVPAGTVVHNGSMDCLGLLVICTGQLRAYILSPDGREVTVYRLFDWDVCLLAASCVMQSIQFEITIEAEKDTEMWVIPPRVYKELAEKSLAVANYTNQIMAARFSEAMWLIEQVMWKSFDKRLAEFLLEERAVENGPVLQMTHEKIANHLGTAREVVTRMLRYFQNEGLVRLSRGSVELTDEKGLKKLAKG